MCALGLHKKLVYRLAAYQVFTSMVYAAIWMTFVALAYFRLHDVVKIFTTVGGAASFAFLMFTFWISFHLTSLAIAHRNLARLEPLYVFSSVLTSALVSALGFGVAYGAKSYSSYEVLNIVVLGAARSVLVIVTLCLVVLTGSVLWCRACCKAGDVERQHKKALYEMMPLLVYPILQSFLGIPAYLYGNTSGRHSRVFFVAYSYLVQLWCLLAALSLTTHILVIRCMQKKKLLQRGMNRYVVSVENRTAAVHQTSDTPARSTTYFSFSEES